MPTREKPLLGLDLSGWPWPILTLLLGAPALVGLAWLVADAIDSPLAVDQPPEPIVVEVIAGTEDAATQVTVELVAGSTATVLSPVTGRVTAVGIAPGDLVASGDVAMAVNDGPLVAYTASSPLWRDIGPGASGPDVTRAQELLDDLGYDAGRRPATVTRATQEAIRRFHADRGLDPTDPVLHVGELLWIGQEPAEVAEVAVSVGDAVEVGTEAFSIQVSPPELRLLSPGELPEGALRLVVGSTSVPVDDTHVVTDPDSIAAVRPEFGESTKITGTALLMTPEPVGIVPASAIVTAPDGRTCIYPADSSAVPVTVRGGTVVSVAIEAEWVGERVLANPQQFHRTVECS